jgi:hypothetical protein
MTSQLSFMSIKVFPDVKSEKNVDLLSIYEKKNGGHMRKHGGHMGKCGGHMGISLELNFRTYGKIWRTYGKKWRTYV